MVVVPETSTSAEASPIPTSRLESSRSRTSIWTLLPTGMSPAEKLPFGSSSLVVDVVTPSLPVAVTVMLVIPVGCRSAVVGKSRVSWTAPEV